MNKGMPVLWNKINWIDGQSFYLFFVVLVFGFLKKFLGHLYLTKHELLPNFTEPFLGFSHSNSLFIWIFLNDETIRAIRCTLFSRTRKKYEHQYGELTNLFISDLSLVFLSLTFWLRAEYQYFLQSVMWTNGLNNVCLGHVKMITL
jgi:hypothetical protein